MLESTSYPAPLNQKKSMCLLSGIYDNCVCVFVFVFQGQIMANLKAMDSDWFGQTYLGRKSKVKISADQLLAFSQNGSIQYIWMLAACCNR